ncbi:MAG: DUF4338 domain-containing protein [Acidobacteriia bacterium]|nr:DUF4338 domain-containing protein [Terriglobia bacterium]MYG01816.1 DUF4338 domain-containing protein [Terriglobia bacterium]MYK08442.1 DUF4338 domain-containing protein [Terriglobia bacterium]
MPEDSRTLRSHTVNTEGRDRVRRESADWAPQAQAADGAMVRRLQWALQRGGFSRAGSARELCERDGWRNPRGKLYAASARKALPRLAKQLGLALPPIQVRGPSCRQRGVQGPRPVQFAGSLRQLGEVWLERAQTPAQRRLRADLLRSGHPLGAGRAPGCRVQYLLASRLGPVSVLSFVAASLRLGPRDRHLGWDDRTRGARVGAVVSNDRWSGYELDR